MERIVARRALLAAAVVGIVAQALFVGLAFGVNVVVATALVLAAAATLGRLAGRRPDPLDGWLPIAAGLVAAGTALRSDDTLMFLDAVTAATLVGASVAAFAGAAVTRRSTLAIVGLGSVVLLWVTIGILRLSETARRPGPDRPRRSLSAPARGVVRGLALAVPLLLVFGLLFASADAIFASFAGHLVDWQVDLGELPLRTGVAFLIAWVVAGLLAVATGIGEIRLPSDAHATEPLAGAPPPMQSLGAMVATPAPAAAATPRLGTVEALTILVAVDALFALFVGLQLAYLFGGLDTMAAGGITYASYARRGFFELVAVTCLAGCVVVGLHAVVAERTRAFVAASLALAGLTAIVLVSAAFRLALYQDAYGWTELRLYVAATIVWLAIGIAAAAVLLVRDRMRWLGHAMAIGAIAVLVVMNAIGPQRVVAEANVARLLDPSLVPPDGRQGIDLDYALTLGHDADPSLVAALPALTGSDRERSSADLETRWLDLGESGARRLAGVEPRLGRGREARSTRCSRPLIGWRQPSAGAGGAGGIGGMGGAPTVGTARTADRPRRRAAMTTDAPQGSAARRSRTRSRRWRGAWMKPTRVAPAWSTSDGRIPRRRRSGWPGRSTPNVTASVA